MKIKWFFLGSTLLLCCSCSSLVFWKKPEVEVKAPQFDARSELSNVVDRHTPVISVPQPPVVNDIAKIDSSRVSFKKEDLTLLIKGDPELNRYHNSSHALFLCVYQLKDPNAFNQLAEEKEGIAKLLECGRFDSSVANAKRVVVQPGQQIRESRDRAEGARFIGIASGYYGTGKEKMAHLAPLSVVNGDFSGNTIEVELGQYEIDKVTVK